MDGDQEWATMGAQYCDPVNYDGGSIGRIKSPVDFCYQLNRLAFLFCASPSLISVGLGGRRRRLASPVCLFALLTTIPPPDAVGYMQIVVPRQIEKNLALRSVHMRGLL